MEPLYKLVEQFKDLEKLGESDDLPIEVIRDTLEGLEGDIQTKTKQVAFVIRNLEASASAIKAEATAMKMRGERVQTRADSLKQYVLFSLQAVGHKKFEYPEFTVSVRDNPEAVVINEGTVLDANYMVQPEPPPPRPDKDKLKLALKAGEEIRGVWLQRGQHLRITI